MNLNVETYIGSKEENQKRDNVYFQLLQFKMIHFFYAIEAPWAWIWLMVTLRAEHKLAFKYEKIAPLLFPILLFWFPS